LTELMLTPHRHFSLISLLSHSAKSANPQLAAIFSGKAAEAAAAAEAELSGIKK
jgi:hypothetical protein